MSEKKYEKYIHTHVPSEMQKNFKQPKRVVEQREKGNYMDATWMFHLQEDVVKGVFYTSGVWMWEKHGPDPLRP